MCKPNAGNISKQAIYGNIQYTCNRCRIACILLLWVRFCWFPFWDCCHLLLLSWSPWNFTLPLNSPQWTMQRYSQVKLSPEKHVANVLKSWASQRPLELHIDTFALHLQEMLRTCYFFDTVWFKICVFAAWQHWIILELLKEPLLFLTRSCDAGVRMEAAPGFVRKRLHQSIAMWGRPLSNALAQVGTTIGPISHLLAGEG